MPSTADLQNGQLDTRVATGGIWFSHLGWTPQNRQTKHLFPGDLVGLRQM